MKYIGLDVHKKQSTICILDNNGKRQLTKTVRGPWSKVLLELQTIRRPFSICYKASTGYGYLYEQLKGMARHVAVAHPGHLRLIFRSKKKNDRVDAEKLAKLLFLGEAPLVHVPKEEVRSWRSMIEYRHRMVGERTRVKNAIRALCRSHGIETPKYLWAKKGILWLSELIWPTAMVALQRDMLVERLESMNAMIGRVEASLDSFGRHQIGVRLLKSIPGVGDRTAEAVAAYIDDASRFGDSKSIGCYFGLIPSQDSSASVNRLGHITCEGPATVRKLLAEASWQGIRRSPRIRAYYERIRRNDPERNKIALVATAHYLARVMLAMLKTGEFWRDDEMSAA